MGSIGGRSALPFLGPDTRPRSTRWRRSRTSCASSSAVGHQGLDRRACEREDGDLDERRQACRRDAGGTSREADELYAARMGGLGVALKRGPDRPRRGRQGVEYALTASRPKARSSSGGTRISARGSSGSRRVYATGCWSGADGIATNRPRRGRLRDDRSSVAGCRVRRSRATRGRNGASRGRPGGARCPWPSTRTRPAEATPDSSAADDLLVSSKRRRSASVRGLIPARALELREPARSFGEIVDDDPSTSIRRSRRHSDGARRCCVDGEHGAIGHPRIVRGGELRSDRGWGEGGVGGVGDGGGGGGSGVRGRGVGLGVRGREGRILGGPVIRETMGREVESVRLSSASSSARRGKEGV